MASDKRSIITNGHTLTLEKLYEHCYLLTVEDGWDEVYVMFGVNNLFWFIDADIRVNHPEWGTSVRENAEINSDIYTGGNAVDTVFAELTAKLFTDKYYNYERGVFLSMINTAYAFLKDKHVDKHMH